MNNPCLIECVPNFSEGRDMSVIKQITDEISSVEGVKLLDVDPGKTTNRTVVTFVGKPDAVVQAAFLAICKAGELIDMSKHKGEHPRMGCLLYTSDAADERSSVDLGGRRIIKKKKKRELYWRRDQ